MRPNVRSDDAPQPQVVGQRGFGLVHEFLQRQTATDVAVDTEPCLVHEDIQRHEMDPTVVRDLCLGEASDLQRGAIERADLMCRVVERDVGS